MDKAQEGDAVKVHYKGKLPDGTTFDSSEGRDPIDFKIGEGKIIPGFEKAVIGMEPNQTKTETIPASDAYGERKDELVFQVERSQFPQQIEPKVGQGLQIQAPTGQTFQVTVAEVQENQVTLDANHPLAGKDLTFEITLVEIGG